MIATWVGTSQELLLLAPSTEPPLTARKVLAWRKPGAIAFVHRVDVGEQTTSIAAPAIAYGEINPMRNSPEHFWLGHVVVEPTQRGSGLGRSFVLALVDHAHRLLGARRISLVVFPDNEPAIRCYSSAGFRNMGEENHQFSSDGPFHRLLRFEATP